MNLDLSTDAVKLITDSAAGEEVAAFAVWLYPERYSTFTVSPWWLRTHCARTKTHSAKNGRLNISRGTGAYLNYHVAYGCWRVVLRRLPSFQLRILSG